MWIQKMGAECRDSGEKRINVWIIEIKHNKRIHSNGVIPQRAVKIRFADGSNIKSNKGIKTICKYGLY